MVLPLTFSTELRENGLITTLITGATLAERRYVTRPLTHLLERVEFAEPEVKQLSGVVLRVGVGVGRGRGNGGHVVLRRGEPVVRLWMLHHSAERREWKKRQLDFFLSL